MRSSRGKGNKKKRLKGKEIFNMLKKKPKQCHRSTRNIDLYNYTKKEKQIKASKTWMSPWKCTEIVRISNKDKADIHKGLREIRWEKMGL